jgi:hypothetical protein
VSAFDEGRQGPQLVHIATDGETYGHHHRHGDMALAYALEHIEQNNPAKLTNYAQFLELHPPTHEVQIVENSSWSCVHGIERWRSNCGCNSGRQGWNQEWRAPLRAALDWLRDAIEAMALTVDDLEEGLTTAKAPFNEHGVRECRALFDKRKEEALRAVRAMKRNARSVEAVRR